MPTEPRGRSNRLSTLQILKGRLHKARKEKRLGLRATLLPFFDLTASYSTGHSFHRDFSSRRSSVVGERVER